MQYSRYYNSLLIARPIIILSDIEKDNGDGTAGDTNEPHAFIHILTTKTGEKYQRLIVPTCSAIKKFEYDKYVENSNIYKEKQQKYKNREGEKVKCFVLFAAGKQILEIP